MGAKEYLRQLHMADVAIRQRKREREFLMERLTGIGGFGYRDRIQTSRSGNDRFEREITRVADIDTEIGRMIEGYARLRHRIIGEIQAVGDSRYAEILHRRYVDWESLREIADGMGYSFSHTRRLHGEALREFSRHMDFQDDTK